MNDNRLLKRVMVGLIKALIKKKTKNGKNDWHQGGRDIYRTLSQDDGKQTSYFRQHAINTNERWTHRTWW